MSAAPDELPDDVVALLRDADRVDVISDATRRAAWAGIEAQLGGSAAATTMGKVASAASLTRLLVTGVVAVAGLGVAGALLKQRAPDAPVVAPAVTAVVDAGANDLIVADPPASPPPAPVVVAPPPPPPTAPVPSKRVELDRERAAIEEARALLARSDLDGASAALDEHRRRYARGALVEDREALAVMLAWRRGDADAVVVDAAFRARYPQSVYGPAIARQRIRAERGQ